MTAAAPSTAATPEGAVAGPPATDEPTDDVPTDDVEPAGDVPVSGEPGDDAPEGPAASPGDPDRPDRPVHRLRDLRGPARWVALVLFLALLAPYVGAVVHAVRDDWVPSNDDALLALRVQQVLDGEFPLVGQPSTAAHYSDRAEEPPRHPGPIQFYLFAPIVAATGFDVGMLVGPALLNFAAVAVAAWAILRRAGPQVGALGAVVLGLLAYAQGPVQLADPLSSNQGGIGLVALAVVGWAILDGDVRLLPWAAFWFAWVAQQHLAILGIAGGLAAWIAACVALLLWTARRRGEPERLRSTLVWSGVALGVSVLAWLPVIVDQLADSGNVTNFVHYARDGGRDTVGLTSGLRQAARVFRLPPLLVGTGHRGHGLWTPLGTGELVGIVVVLAALAGVVADDVRRRRRSRLALAATLAALCAIGTYTGANVPLSVEANRINFYRWLFVGCALVWIILAWWAGERLAPLVARRIGTGYRRALPAVAVAAAVLVSAVAITSGRPDQDSDVHIFGAERTLRAAAAAATAGHDRVLVVASGPAAALSVGPTVALHLADRGHRIVVPARDRDGYGADRVTDGRYDVVVIVESSTDAWAEDPDDVVASVWLNDSPARRRADAARERALARLEASPPTFDRTIVDRLADYPAEDRQAVFEYARAAFEETPRAALASPAMIDLLDRGLLRSPRIDTADLHLYAGLDEVRVWNQDRIRVRVLTPEAYRRIQAAIDAAAGPREGAEGDTT